ncbi:hypothetical protein CTZ27_36305 [Streptomyces griseocarneus]|nr:hypothetical protein CTZ27_36305 [Streptomyces griseocarneus]
MPTPADFQVRHPRSVAAREESPSPLFRCDEVALLRAPVLPHDALRHTWVDLPPGAPDEHERLVRYVKRIATASGLRDALAVASPSLTRVVDAVCAKESVGPVGLKQLRKTANAVSRYHLRMASRPTPFGLFSGVAAAQVADRAEARIGTAHRVTVRPDMGWLTAFLTTLETAPDVLVHLRVTANGLAFVRGDRLVLPYVPERDAAARAPGQVVVEVSVRHTAAVRAVLEHTARPVAYTELRERIRARFPGTDDRQVDGVLRQLVEREFLLTDLRPPADAPDPLEHALARLPAGPARDGLSTVDEALRSGPKESGRLEDVAQLMRRLHAADRPLQVDLAVDADVRLPAAVTAEAERAATALWRMSLVRTVPHLAQYHGDFLERYGTDRLVPVCELLDPDRGLGAPAGYLMPPSEREKPTATAGATREAGLRLALAQEAILSGRREVVLDDGLVAALSPAPTLPPPASLDLYARVLARSADELSDGRFRLWLTPGTGADQAGATIGRFSHLLPDAARRIALASLAAETAATDAVGAQLSLRTAYARSANVTRVPRFADQRIVVGAFADHDDPDVVPLDDLAVGADLDGLYLVRSSTGRRVVPLAWNMLNPKAQIGNVGRFLREIRLSGVRPGFSWDWGPMEAAPYTPRVRYGRTVLAPARWLPTEPFFTDTGLSDHAWRLALDCWRERWGVPDHVLLCVADRSLELNLAAGLHVRLLRQDVTRWPDAVLRETPGPGDSAYGWLPGEDGAHAAEAVFPLFARPPRPTGVPRSGSAAMSRPQTPRPFRAQAPGGQWLYAKVYGSSARQNEILTAHLPRLLTELPAEVDRWFFVRYRDPAPHLRLRFHGEPAGLNRRLLPAVHDWFAGLHRSGLAGRLALDTYDPEWERYGGPAAMAAAEEAFCADSDAVITQLGLLETGRLRLEPAVLGALNMLDILRHAHGGDDAEAWLLAAYPRSAAHDALRNSRMTTARLGDPSADWAALRAVSGGAELLTSWQRRADALNRYGALLRAPGTRETASRGTALAALLHLHHNRLLGLDREREEHAQATARGALEIHRARRRETASRAPGSPGSWA